MLKKTIDEWSPQYAAGSEIHRTMKETARCLRDLVVNLVIQISLPGDRNDFLKTATEHYGGKDKFDLETRAQLLSSFHKVKWHSGDRQHLVTSSC